MQFYLNESRASDPYSLPDAEVFYRTDTALAADDWRDSDGDVMKAGWYVWVCFPGCLPESDPCGPFASQEEAVKYARDLYGDDDDDSPDVA